MKIKKQRTKEKRKQASFTTKGFEAQPIQRDRKREKAQPNRVDLKATTQEKHIKKHEELKKQQLW